jgi:hypothetical protein
MNTNLHDMPQADDLPFDRLVDGELSEEKRRELLAGLDNEPGGWRRCALAFLESQCWKQSLGQTAGASTADGTRRVPDTLADGTRSAPATYQRSPWPGRVGTLAAMAASFLLVLGLGSWALRFRVVPPSGGLAGGGAANQVALTGGGRQLVSQVSQSGALSPSNRIANPWRLVTVSDGRDPAASFNLPAIECNNIDQQWLKNMPPAIPDNVLQALARTGHQIQQRRELVPVPLKDGRQLVMPVDQVEVHYVGNKTY